MSGCFSSGYQYSARSCELIPLGSGDFVNNVRILTEFFLPAFSSVVSPSGPGKLFSSISKRSFRVLPIPVLPDL